MGGPHPTPPSPRRKQQPRKRDTGRMRGGEPSVSPARRACGTHGFTRARRGGRRGRRAAPRPRPLCTCEPFRLFAAAAAALPGTARNLQRIRQRNHHQARNRVDATAGIGQPPLRITSHHFRSRDASRPWQRERLPLVSRRRPCRVFPDAGTHGHG